MKRSISFSEDQVNVEGDVDGGKMKKKTGEDLVPDTEILGEENPENSEMAGNLIIISTVFFSFSSFGQFNSSISFSISSKISLLPLEIGSDCDLIRFVISFRVKNISRFNSSISFSFRGKIYHLV